MANIDENQGSISPSLKAQKLLHKKLLHKKLLHKAFLQLILAARLENKFKAKIML